MQFGVVSYRLTGGFHLRAEISIKTFYFVPGEDGNFDIITFSFLRIEIENSLFLQTPAEDNFGRYVGKGPACGLREEGYCSL